MIPPKPKPRADRISLWQHLRMFRADILSAQPARLYRAWMAEFRTPFFRSYLCNDPDLIETVLKRRPEDFPKSDRVREGLAPLLGRSVFVTNGAEWARQRRIIDPAFGGGRLHETFPAMCAAAFAARDRLAARAGQVVEIEEESSHAAADVIFRTLFSIPIDHHIARATFHAFRCYQKAQPLLNPGAFLPLPSWVPRFHRREVRRSARQIRNLIRQLTAQRLDQIAAGNAPDDLATKILTTPDPETGQRFELEEMVDQVAIFFLAGHETSAAAIGWALYLLASTPDWQERLTREARDHLSDPPDFSDMARLKLTRDVFRETLRLYPPVPMMVRQARCPVTFRGRDVAPGSQIVLSPWHVHRHERLWCDPDAFNPERWQGPEGREVARRAWLPFSAGPRVCPGAGFAMIEGVLVLSVLLRDLQFHEVEGKRPQPVAHLTVRSRDGIWLRIERREK